MLKKEIQHFLSLKKVSNKKLKKLLVVLIHFKKITHLLNKSLIFNFN